MSEHDSDHALPMSDFDYELPEHLIAQTPLEDRDASRLLVLDRKSGEVTHSTFRDLSKWLRSGDLLVINDTRVLHARLRCRRETGGMVEFLLVEQIDEHTWSAMGRPVRRLKPGEALLVLDRSGEPSGQKLRVIRKDDDGMLLVQAPPLDQIEDRLGEMPLPGYISIRLSNPERYQTIYSRQAGSVAAPTAGLHFTENVLAKLQELGIEIAKVTLHVGPGTFTPVKTEDAREHSMHAERFFVPAETLQAVLNARKRGRRVIAVGTTSCRTLESVAERLSDGEDISGATDLYITPGFEFRVIDGLLTNFHLPRSTLLLLVCAFAGREPLLTAYREAVRLGYRFYSFGDATLVM